MKISDSVRLVIVFVLWILIPCAHAQQTTQGSSTGTSSSGTAAPNPAPNPVPMIPATGTYSSGSRAPQFPTVPEIIYIAGTVVQEDGSPPPFGTLIELDCGDTVTREATANADGHFGFQVGSSNRIGRVMADPADRIEEDVFDAAAASQNPAAGGFSTSMRTTPLFVRLLRCEVRARYPGYRSTSARMRAGAISGYTEVGTILMYQIAKVQGTSVSVTSLLAPKKAKQSIEQAGKLLKKGKFAEAEVLLKSAIAAYPENAEAWFLLGEAYHFQSRTDDAWDSYSRALQADRMFVRPYLRLARLSMADEDWEAAADFSGKALQLDPIAFPEAYYLNALANFNLEDLVAAERSARRGQRLDLERQYPQMHLILANILSMNQDLQGAVEEMRKYLKAAPKAEDAPLVRARLEEKEKLAKAEVK